MEENGKSNSRLTRRKGINEENAKVVEMRSGERVG